MKINFLLLIYILFLLGVFLMNNIHGKMMNEDIQQILYGMDSIKDNGNLKYGESFVVDGYRNGPSFAFYNEEGESVANKFPSMIFFYTSILIVPGFDMFFYINIFLGFFFLLSLLLVSKKIEKSRYNFWIPVIVGSSGLFLSYATYFFESFVYGGLLLLGLYYYLDKKFLGYFFLTSVFLVRPEYGLLVGFLCFYHAIKQKTIIPIILFSGVTLTILGINYKLTGYFNFLNSGNLTQGLSSSNQASGNGVLNTAIKYIFTEIDLEIVWIHFIFLISKTSFLSPLFIVLPGALLYFFSKKRLFFLIVTFLFIMLFIYGTRSFYYGFNKTNYYSSYIRYCLVPLLFFIFLSTRYLVKIVSDRLARLFILTICIFISFLTYIVGGPDIAYNVYGRISVTVSHEKIISIISSLVNPEDLIISDGSFDKLIIRTNRNIIQLDNSSEVDAVNFIQYVRHLNIYAQKNIFIIARYSSMDKVNNLLNWSSTENSLVYSNKSSFCIWKIR